MVRQAQYAHSQALYDEQQVRFLETSYSSVSLSTYRLFRMSDFELREVHGRWRLRNLVFGEEWTADWQGRRVAVRMVHGNLLMKVCPVPTRNLLNCSSIA